MICYERCENPVVMRKDIHISGVKYVYMHEYNSGHKVPIFLVENYYALNKILGYAKYINGDYGTILYRGECSLHNTMLPSIHRGIKSKRAHYNANFKLNDLEKHILSDKKIAKVLVAENQPCRELVIEGLLQHYGIKTHFIDVVDNHWIALWFGLYRATQIKSVKSYICYTKRTVNKVKYEDDDYQYMILIASSNNITNLFDLNKINGETVTIDLRANTPSIFLRPHAQHGLVIRRLRNDKINGYDISKYVVGIIKIPIIFVDKWLGDGTLLTVDNLFPSPAYDIGYDLLLERSDLFKNSICRIAY